MRREADNVYLLEDDNVYAEGRLGVLLSDRLAALLKVCRNPLKNTTSRGRSFVATAVILIESDKDRETLGFIVNASAQCTKWLSIEKEDKAYYQVDTFVKILPNNLRELRLRVVYRIPLVQRQNRSRY